MLEIKSIAILANLYWVNQYNYRPQPHAWSPIGDWCHRQSLNQLFPLQPANYISDKWATMVSEKNPLIYTNEITKACRCHPQILPCLMLNNPAWNTLVSRRLPLPMGLNFSFNNRIRLAPPDDSRILTVNDVARGCCTTNAWQIYTYLNNDPITPCNIINIEKFSVKNLPLIFRLAHVECTVLNLMWSTEIQR